MKRESKVNIHQNYTYITRKINTPGVFSPIAILKIPGSTVFRMENETPLVLKLYKSKKHEISKASEICLYWIPSDEDPLPHYTRETMNNKYCSNIFNYGTFERISNEDQEKNKTQTNRLIRFDKKASILTSGLSPGCKLLLMLRSPDIIDWERSEFNFDIFVLDKTN